MNRFINHLKRFFNRFSSKKEYESIINLLHLLLDELQDKANKDEIQPVEATINLPEIVIPEIEVPRIPDINIPPIAVPPILFPSGAATEETLKNLLEESRKNKSLEVTVKNESLTIVPLQLQAQLGLSKQYSYVPKFGRVKGVNSLIPPVDLWAFADKDRLARSPIKTFPNSPDTVFVFSDSPEDTNLIVRLEALDKEGWQKNIVVKLDGQKEINTQTIGLDINRIRVISKTSSKGSIYASVGSSNPVNGLPTLTEKVVAVAPRNYNGSQLSHYRVPKGKIAILDDMLLTISRAGASPVSSEVLLIVKPLEKSPIVEREFFPTNYSPISSGVRNIVADELSQITWRCVYNSHSDTNYSVSYTFFLLDKDSQ